MAHKLRPFTRRQRARALKARIREDRAAARERREEEKDYQQSLRIFAKCDVARTEALADLYKTRRLR